MSQKLTILVAGATGNTGRSIVQGLLRCSETFNVIALTRPSSLSKPDVEELRSQGVEIQVADIGMDSVDKLQEILSGVDIIISAVNSQAVLKQTSLFAAAKQADIKRVVPCEFATPGRRGMRELHDQKLDIREHIKELGLHYTFIDVGWWMQLMLPSSTKVTSILGAAADEVFGDKPMLVTDLNHIGDYVARIIADERTLDHYVIVWEDQVTEREARVIAGRVTGEADDINARTKYISNEELLQRVEIGREDYARTGKMESLLYLVLYSQFFISMQIHGENTLEFAKSVGALDVRELYPDIRPETLEEFARKFYAGGSNVRGYF